ncbi:MAG: sterol desaturase family protein [Sandaracinaceae bacterium]|nr:sterol desaturase family protein [Sandaracinaceae bacterium]
MGSWLTSLGFAEALALVAAYSIGLTLFSLAAGFSAERAMQRRGRAIFAVPLKRGQLRTEALGTALFHAVWIPSAAALLASGWLRAGEGALLEVATFFGSMIGFQAFYWFLHRAMHLRPLFFIHRWHHESLVTTPLTGFSMSPLEAIGWVVGFLGPLVVGSLAGGVGVWGYLAFLTFAWYGNIVGHANAELMPAPTSTRWGSRLFSNPIAYHALHHARFDRHYGFATAWMDAIFGTQWEDWIEVSERARAGRPLTKIRERARGAEPASEGPSV